MRVQHEQHAGRLALTLVVEVLAPGQDERTLAGLLADYAAIGILEVWFADQEANSIRVLALNGVGYRAADIFGPSNDVVSGVLPGLGLVVSVVFA